MGRPINEEGGWSAVVVFFLEGNDNVVCCVFHAPARFISCGKVLREIAPTQRPSQKLVGQYWYTFYSPSSDGDNVLHAKQNFF